MVCGPRRYATCNGSRSSYPRAACTFTASRTGFPAYIQSAVTRCERCASYAASTLKRLTCSFPSAAGPSVPSASIASSSASARLPRCLSRSTPTCFAMPVGSSSPTMVTTRALCSTTSATGTSSIRSGTPKWRRTVSRIFGANWRRQARDRFPLDYLGIRRRVPLGNHLFDDLDAALDLLGAHRLDAAGMLQLHLPRHQQGAYLHVGSGLIFPHLRNRGRPRLFEVGGERGQGVLVERATCSLQGPARVSRIPRREFAVDALGDVVRIGFGIECHRGVLCLLRAWRITIEE